MSTCNLCMLKKIRKRARDNSHTILQLTHPGKMGGIDIFSIPRVEYAIASTTLRTLYRERAGNITSKVRDRYLVTWLMTIPDQCEC